MGYTLEVLLTLFEQFIFVDYIDMKFERMYSKPYIYILFITLLTAVTSICNLNNIISNFTILIVISLALIVMKNTYYIDIKTSIIATMIFYAISLSIDVSILTIGSGLNSEQVVRYLNVGDTHRIVVGFFSKSILFIVSKTIGNRSIKYKELPKKYWYFIIASYTMSIAIMFFITEMVFSINMMKDSLALVTVACAGILIFNIINVYVYLSLAEYYQDQADNVVIESCNDVQYKYMLQNEDAFKEIRKVKHDLNNKLIGLLYLVEQERGKEAIEYIKEINEDLQEASIYYMTGHTIVDAIINQKYCICKEHNIEFTLKRSQIKYIAIRPQDLCNILGNALDNAIEGCINARHTDKQIGLEIYTNKEYLIINIKNTCRSDLISENLETKKNKKWHGIGIKSIKETANRYEGNVVLEHKDDIFTTKVILKNR